MNENLSEEKQNELLSYLIHYADMADRRAIEKEDNIELAKFAKTLGVVPYLDGNKWCALYGENIQAGIVGFGHSPIAAIEALQNAFYAKLED